MPGPFFLHWVDASDFVWDEYGSLAVNDEEVLGFDCAQSEGDFADLSIDVRNPKIGLLSTTRKVWAWLSWDRAWVPPVPSDQLDLDVHVPDIVPLFFGRLVGIPTNINQEIVTLSLVARPADYVTQKIAFAETLKVAPFYNKIWINPARLDDPDTVLEARSALWSIDRVTHALGISDVLSGEDGVAAFLASEVPYDQVQISIGQAPLRGVTVNADINWTQAGSEVIDFGTRTFETYTGSSTVRDWPKPGTNLQAGWSVESAAVIDHWHVEEAFTASYSTNWQSIEPKHNPGDTVSSSLSSTVPVLEGPGTPYLSTVLTQETHSGVGSASNSSNTLYVLKHLLTTSLALRYNAARSRTERIKFTLTANLQPIVVDVNEQEVDVITISSVDVGLPMPDASIPIGDVSRSQFVTTDEGIAALEYLISMARARLLLSARCVNITFPCKFARAIELSCRMNASIQDDRLPGGSAIGKIISYSFKCDPQTGEQTGTVTIGCAVGYGGFVTAVDGDPEYCDTDYCEDDYQEFSGGVTVLTGGNVGYSIPLIALTDDGLRFPLTKDQVVVRDQWVGSLADQEETILAAFPIDTLVANQSAPFTLDELHAQQALASKTVTEVMKDHAIWRDLEVRPIAGTFVNEYAILTTQLEVPQMLNLEDA